MKRNRLTILLGSAFAVALVFCAVLGYKWYRAEQRYIFQRDEILSSFDSQLQTLVNCPSLLDENGALEGQRTRRITLAAGRVYDQCNNVSAMAGHENGWEYILAAGSNFLADFLNLYSNVAGSYSQSGQTLSSLDSQLIEGLDEAMAQLSAVVRQSYQERGDGPHRIGDGSLFRFYNETLIPALRQNIWENEEFAKLIDKLTNLRTLVAS